MPRKARVVAVGCPHHVTQRGNNRGRVFFSDTDHEIYLKCLREFAERYRLSIWGYCLMPDHVHLLVFPEAPDSMAKVLGRTHGDYARYSNVIHRHSGHLWQARYYSCPLGEAQRWRALAYIERNPVRAGICASAAEYRWSSARAHLANEDPAGLLELETWRAVYKPERWAQVLELGVGEEAFQERLRQATDAGMPLGDEAFVKEWERALGRALAMRAPGRPRSGRPVALQLEAASLCAAH